MDTPKDLHIAKASHLSIPVAADMEFHLRKQDAPGSEGQKVGDHAMVMVPSIVTSIDKEDIRYKQVGRVQIAKNPQPSAEDILEGLSE